MKTILKAICKSCQCEIEPSQGIVIDGEVSIINGCLADEALVKVLKEDQEHAICFDCLKSLDFLEA